MRAGGKKIVMFDDEQRSAGSGGVAEGRGLARGVFEPSAGLKSSAVHWSVVINTSNVLKPEKLGD